jgi:hypothetical protein
LNLDSLIVDGHLDETRVAPTEDERQADLDRLAKLVTGAGADLGGAVRRRRGSGSRWSTSAAPSSASTGPCCCSST